jgi:hypothetical protein
MTKKKKATETTRVLWWYLEDSYSPNISLANTPETEYGAVFECYELLRSCGWIYKLDTKVKAPPEGHVKGCLCQPCIAALASIRESESDLEQDKLVDLADGGDLESALYLMDQNKGGGKFYYAFTTMNKVLPKKYKPTVRNLENPCLSYKLSSNGALLVNDHGDERVVPKLSVKEEASLDAIRAECMLYGSWVIDPDHAKTEKWDYPTSLHKKDAPRFKDTVRVYERGCTVECRRHRNQSKRFEDK